MVGSELTRQLKTDGHEIVSLVRRPASSTSEATWDPSAGAVPQSAIESADAVINLSGASLGKLPWLPGYKKTILQSRLQTTSTLASAISAAAAPPTVFLSASAVGFYGDRPPFADRMWSLRRGAPVLVVAIDTPKRMQDCWPLISDLTSEHGLVTSELVPTPFTAQ